MDGNITVIKYYSGNDVQMPTKGINELKTAEILLQQTIASPHTQYTK